MTREKAIEILISVAVCDRPILSCDFCARYVGIGTHCNYPPDEEIEEAVLLLKGASNDAAISAIRQQEHFRDVTKKVEPLTMDELRKMDGEPVWIVEYPDWGHWELSADAEDYVTDREPSFYGMKHNDPAGRYGLHKLGWLAYRQKPEEVQK